MIHARTVVLEGMPSAGKTTLAALLGEHGWCVVPEYVGHEGTWPATVDDDAHQRNWLLKERLLQDAPSRPTVVDRNFLTSLAYAYSVRLLPGESRLLSERSQWLCRHLVSGAFQHPALYCVLDLDPDTSLRRRGSEKPSDHPWAKPEVLAELREFYARMPEGLGELHPDLAPTAAVRVLRLPGVDPLAANVESVEQAISPG